MDNDSGVYDLLARVMQHPEFQLAFQGVAGETMPAQRIINEMAPQPGAQAPQAPQAPVMPEQQAQQDAFEAAFAKLGIDPNLARVESGHSAAGDMAVDPVLLSALTNKADAVAPQPGGGGDGSWINDVVSGAQSPRGDGLIGQYLPEGVSNMIAGIGTGLAASDPRAPATTAFGQAFAGAQASQQARLDRKRAEQAAERDYAWKLDERTYTRGEDAEDDTREEARLEIERKKAEREDRLSQLEEIQIAAGIQHTQAETAKIERELRRSGLTFDQQMEVEQRVLEKFIPRNPVRPLEQEDIDALKPGMDAYRTELINRAKAGDEEAAAGGVGGTSVAPKVDPDAPMTEPTGEGTQEAPLTGLPNDDVEAKRILDERYRLTGRPVYFLDENGQPREYDPSAQ